MDFSAGFTFICPVKTHSGNRALEHLPAELSGLNAVRPLIVASLKAVGQRGIRTVTDAFGDSGMTLGVFDAVTDAADLGLIEHLRTLFAKGRYDAIVALGGGGAVDAAKVLNMALSPAATDARKLSGETAIPGPLGPLVVVPTAAATGLETSRYAFFDRMAFSSVHLMPDLAVIDPRMIRAKEGKIAATAGLAALGRSLEALAGPDGNPFMAPYAFAAIRFLAENLVAAAKDPGDQKAALAVANASAMSGCAVSNAGPGTLHRLGQILQDLVRLPPGATMGMCLSLVIGDYAGEDSRAAGALLLPLAGEDAYAATPEAQRAGAALAALDGLLDDLYAALGDGMPRTLGEAGVPAYLMDDVFEVLDGEGNGAYLRSVIERVRVAAPRSARKGGRP